MPHKSELTSRMASAGTALVRVFDPDMMTKRPGEKDFTYLLRFTMQHTVCLYSDVGQLSDKVLPEIDPFDLPLRVILLTFCFLADTFFRAFDPIAAAEEDKLSPEALMSESVLTSFTEHFDTGEEIGNTVFVSVIKVSRLSNFPTTDLLCSLR